MALSEQASFAALLAISSKGKPRFSGLRPVMLCTDFDATHRVDIMRAALGLSDNELADLQAEHLMAGPAARKYSARCVRNTRCTAGKKTCGRDPAAGGARSRIRHEDEPAENAAANAAASTAAAPPNTP